MQCKFNKNWAGFDLKHNKEGYFSDFEKDLTQRRYGRSVNAILFSQRPLRHCVPSSLLHNPQLCIIQHYFLLSI